MKKFLGCVLFFPFLNGCISTDPSYQGNGIPPASEVTRDQANRVIKKKEFYLDGSTKSVTTREYDENGKLKWEKMIETALMKAEEMEAAQAEAGAQQAPPQGPAAQQAPAPQQAPVNASAPTGQGGFAAGKDLPQGSATAQIVNTPIA